MIKTIITPTAAKIISAGMRPRQHSLVGQKIEGDKRAYGAVMESSGENPTS